MLKQALKAQLDEALSMNDELLRVIDDMTASVAKLKGLNDELITMNGVLEQRIYDLERESGGAGCGVDVGSLN